MKIGQAMRTWGPLCAGGLALAGFLFSGCATPPKPFDYTMIPLDDLVLYAAVDADVTRQHVLHQHARMNKEWQDDLAIRARFSMPEPPAQVRSATMMSMACAER